MTDLSELERRYTLAAAVARLEELRTREAVADPEQPGQDALPTLRREESLELLALQELVARKAGYGRQLTVRTARAAGASWAEIGEALGTTRQAAWEAHQRWIDGQAAQFGAVGQIGFDPADTDAARALAGEPDRD
ncbi:hypothetical protein [Blastococcus xanthinilyticus]|uniref:Sigma-70-like protein n=1 Tax=Blastococcus xanthinilyticus TaxID=1564164 RepID=A0A5S5CSL7_9ACTN|nr:hypothetical protein [Blastococcus xanthinilyticus]TYP86801.1 hypothetical protein BD833_10886 [Blastococcus xanthinilyticus]